ncbi:AAA family ATPase [Aliikangiella sp. IMCC44653]
MQSTELIEKIRRLQAVKKEIAKNIVGQEQVVREILICIIAGGHCLLEGVPGLAKTLMVSSIGEALALDFHRVQFTPDLMPSDIIGTEILEEDHTSGKRFFKFQQGPVFTNILLADEINRTPPKTQAALLEAMQEKRVSYAGTTYPLAKPFFVLATQNPVEQSGTYPLPEAQLDRFLMLVKVDYPSQAEEIEILKRTTSSNSRTIQPLLNCDEIIKLQSLVKEVEISDAMVAYTAQIIRETRPAQSGNKMIRDYVNWGAGPRAGQALILCAKANALMEERFAVTLDDLQLVVTSILRHRILLNFQAQADQISVETVIENLLTSIPLPKKPIG